MFASNYYKRDSRYATLYHTQKTQGERRSKENNVNYELGRTCIKVNISCAMNFKWSGIYLKLKILFKWFEIEALLWYDSITKKYHIKKADSAYPDQNETPKSSTEIGWK